MDDVHACFDDIGTDAWSATVEAQAGATCQSHYELSARGYARVFEALAAQPQQGKLTLYDFGAGCGRAVALAVASGAFESARGCEVVPERAAAAGRALEKLNLTAAVVTAGDFCNDDVLETCVLCCDATFDRATLTCIADMLRCSPTWRAMVSFRPPSKWAAAGLTAELAGTGRVATTGEPPEHLTYYLYLNPRSS